MNPPIDVVTGAFSYSGDMMLTRDELDDMMRDILISHEPPRGTTRLMDWLSANRDQIGRAYASEVERHYCPATAIGREARSGPGGIAPAEGAS